MNYGEFENRELDHLQAYTVALENHDNDCNESVTKQQIIFT